MFSILQLILAAGALVLISLVVLAVLTAAGPGYTSAELEYCTKHQICYKYNMLLCTDENCPGRHVCKYCHFKTNREFKHASNDTDKCTRMSQTYRLSLVKVGKGTAPVGYYDHQNEGVQFVASTASTQPLPGTSSQQQSFSGSGAGSTQHHQQSVAGLTQNHQQSVAGLTQNHQQSVAGFTQNHQQSGGDLTQHHQQSGAGFTHNFQTPYFSDSNQVLSEKLAESERARRSMANEVRRLESENEELLQENTRLNLELDQAKAREEASRLKGKVAPPRIRDRDSNPSNNQGSVDFASFPQVPPFMPAVANQVNPGGDRYRQDDYDFATYAYSTDPNQTVDGFPFLGSGNTGRSRSKTLGGGWFNPE